MKSSGSHYIPTLDGWRAVAILLVLFGHGSFFALRGRGWDQIGAHGVEIFFVISGYLITGKLLEEGSLRNFYLRRAFRILPVLLAYLGAIALLGFVLHKIPVAWKEITTSFFFVRNYCYFPSLSNNWFTVHLWSLSIEEQFYLVWPLVLLKVGKGTPRRQLLAAALLFALGCAIIGFVHVGRALHLGGWHWIPFVKFGGLVVGCMLRIFFSDARAASRTTLFDPLICGIALCATLVEPASLIGRVLEFSGLRWIGRLSYSLYIWQQLFLGFAVVYRPFGLFSMFPINFVSLVAVACASYYLMERPMMRWGHNLARRQSLPQSTDTVSVQVDRRQESHEMTEAALEG